MSTITAETVLKLIEQLPPHERTRLNEMLAQQIAAPVKTKPPRDKRVPSQPMPDRTRERQWVEDHKHEHPGQWAALDGDRLIAVCATHMEALDAADADGAYLPIVLRIPSPDDLPFMGI